MGWFKKLLKGILLGLFIAVFLLFIISIIYISTDTLFDTWIIPILLIGFIIGIVFTFLYKKDFPNWLNGGIVGGLIVISFIIIASIIIPLVFDNFADSVGDALLTESKLCQLFIDFPESTVLLEGFKEKTNCFVFTISGLILLFILMGVIIGAFKSKQQPIQPQNLNQNGVVR